MRRIANSTAVGARPTPAASVVAPGYFQEGDGGATQGTILDNDWLNSVQEELIAIILAAAITLDTTGNTNNQVLAAIQALIAAAQGNLSAFDTYTTNQTFTAADFGKGKRLSTSATADTIFTLSTAPPNGAIQLLENSSPTHSLTIGEGASSGFYGFTSAAGYVPVGSEVAAFTLPPKSTAWTVGDRNGFWLVFYNSAAFDAAGSAAAAQAYALALAGNLKGYLTITDADYEVVAADFGKVIHQNGPTAGRTFTIDDGSGIAAGLAKIRIVSPNATFPTTVKIKTGSTATFVSLFPAMNGVTSFTIAAAEIELLWTSGGNWRVTYYSGGFVPLASQLGVMMASSGVGVNFGANYSDTLSITFTAPSNGWVDIDAKLNLGGPAAHNIRCTPKIGTTVIDAGDNTMMSQSYSGGKFVTAGTSVTVSLVVTTTTDPSIVGTYSISARFIQTN